MDRKEIEDLIALMKENGITELSLETPEVKISLKRGPEGADPGGVSAQPEAVPSEAVEGKTPSSAPAAGAGRREAAPIISPVVGIFHNGGMLDPRRLLGEGDHVEEGEMLAAVESMKIPNELRSPFAGLISKVLVNDGDSVEYGQALFLILPEEGGQREELLA